MNRRRKLQATFFGKFGHVIKRIRIKYWQNRGSSREGKTKRGFGQSCNLAEYSESDSNNI